MMQKVALALCLAGAGAFQAPSGVRATTARGAMSEAIPFLEKPPALDGTYPGDKGFDPVGFTKLDWDMSETIVPKKAMGRPSGTLPMVYWMREAELKHGRICMLAIVGWIAVDLGLHFPSPTYEGLTSLTAHNAMVANGNMGFMLVPIFFLETIGAIAVYQAANGSGRAAGDFALDPFKLTNERMLESEITHARLAMFAFSGLCTQSALLEKGFPYF